MTAAPLTSPRPQARNPSFCLRRVTFVSSDKSHQNPLETAFQDFLTRVGYDFALTCPTRNRFSGFFRFKDCASTAFRDALSRDAAPCRGGCLGALPRGYRQIFHHDGRLCPPHMTAASLTSPLRKRGTPFCLRRVTLSAATKVTKTPLETAFQDFLTRVGYDFALTCPTRNRFSGFFPVQRIVPPQLSAMRCRATLPPAAVGALVLYRAGTGRYSITTDDSVHPA